MFSLDNGAIYVSTGLLARLQNDSQLASLIATALTPLVRADNTHSQEAARQRARQNDIPSLLAITLTAGLAAIPIAKHAAKEQERLSNQLRLASDQVAIDWLQRAGYDVAEAPRALQRLTDTLQTESRFGSNMLSNEMRLKDRLAEIRNALPAPAAAEVVSRPAPNGLTPIARKFS